MQRKLISMIDLETFSTNTNAAIASIGAIDFYVGDELKIESEFYVNIEQKSNKEIGRHYSKETIQLWKEQKVEVQRSLLKDQIPIKDAILKFNEWVGNNSIIYCHGLNFDIPIMKSTMEALDIEVPWKYYNVRCSRTLISDFGLDMRDFRDDSTHHNALEDCKAQAKAVNQILRFIQINSK